MTTDSEQDQVAVLEARPDGVEPQRLEAEAAPPAPIPTPPYLAAVQPAPGFTVYAPAPEYAPPYAPALEAAAPLTAKRGRPGWIVPAAIAAVGLIASGALGYLFYTTSTKLDATRHELTVTQSNLDATSKSLDAEKAQAAYVHEYNVDLGRLSTDYSALTECDSYSSCRSAAQAELSDAQAFQSDRKSAKVPSSLSNVDSMLGDALSANITALQDLITALQSHDMERIQNGFSEVNDAMLSVFKTQAALGNLVQ
jgi:hypothetical protein